MFRISNVALALAIAGISVKNSYAFAPTASTTAAFGISRASISSPSTAPCDNDSFPFLATNVANTILCKKHQTELYMSTADEAASAAVPSKLVRKPESSIEITLTAPGKATKAAYDKVCAEVSKTISIPGFRKGAKIPPAVIENAMSAKGGRNALRTQAIQALLNQLLEPALKEEHNLEPIGQPKLVTPVEELAQSFKPGESIEMVVACDVWPDISWKNVEGQEKPYFGLKASYTRKPFNQARFDQAMKDLAERYAVTEPAPEGKELAMGDSCVVDMKGYMAAEDGKTKADPLPDAASGDDVEIVLGEGRYMNGLVEGLVGAKVGETRTVYVTFPTGLRDKTLAGKKAVFDVTVKEASIRTVPEIDDELAQRIRPGLDAEGIKSELRKAVDEQDSGDWIEARNKALAKALAGVMDVEVPDTLVTNQAREKYAQMMAEFRTQGMDDEEIKKLITPENFQKYKNIEKQDIVDDFKTSMAADEIARLEGIEVPSYQIDEQLEAVKKEANGEDLGDENMLRTKIESTIMRRMVFDFLAENAELDVKYEEEKFDEALLEQLAKETMEREAKDLKGKEVTNSKVQVAEDQAKVEAEAKATAEAEAARLKKEEEERLAAEAEAARLKKEEEERLAAEAEAARLKKEEEERLAAEAEAARLKKEEEERLAAEAEAARLKKEEEERLAAEAEAARLKKEEEERLAAEAEAARLKKEEEERLAAEAEAARLKKEEEERLAAEAEAARLKKEEEERLAAEAEAARLKKEEDERLAAEAEAARLKREEEERLAAEAEAARLKKEEEERLAAEAEAARLKKEEEERLAAEAEAKKKTDRIARIAEARRQPKSAEEENAIAERYGAMDLDERAFQILLDLGMIELTPDPDSPDYDPSEDDDLAPENIFSKN